MSLNETPFSAEGVHSFFLKKMPNSICLWSCLQNLCGSCCSLLASVQTSCLLIVDVILLLQLLRSFPGLLLAELDDLSGLSNLYCLR